MTIPSTPSTLPYLRTNIRDLLNEFDAADALASYYALHHDSARTELFLYRNTDGVVEGFLARCRTGFDLFRPLVTMRVRGNRALPLLVREGLLADRPYLLTIPEKLLEQIEPLVTVSEVSHNLILRLDPERFRPVMNVLVVRHQGPNGTPRATIQHGDQSVAIAGVNWRSPVFAELYVHVEQAHRGRGFGRAVVSAVVTELLRLRITPVYSVAEHNTHSHELALSLGFVDTGTREVMAQAVRAELTQD